MKRPIPQYVRYPHTLVRVFFTLHNSPCPLDPSCLPPSESASVCLGIFVSQWALLCFLGLGKFERRFECSRSLIIDTSQNTYW